MKKIRVEVSALATPHQSGIARYTQLLTNSLAKAKNTEVHGSYFNFLNRQQEPVLHEKVIYEKNIFIPLRIYSNLHSRFKAPYFDLFKKKVDVTIQPNYSCWPTIRSRKTITAIHDLTYIHYPELVESKNLAHLRRIVPRTIKKSDYILTISETVKNELMAEFNIDSSRFIVTPIPADDIFYVPSSNEIHKKYNIPTKKYILFIGNLEPRKNLSTLIRAYRLLPEDIRKEYSLIIGGGKGWKFEETEQVLNSGPENENIRRIGFVDQDDLPSLYQHASLFAITSLYEGFGMPILEALASNCPVLASDIPVFRETGGNVITYAAHNSPDDFSDKLITLLKTTPNKKEIRRHLSTISWEENAKKIIQACE